MLGTIEDYTNFRIPYYSYLVAGERIAIVKDYQGYYRIIEHSILYGLVDVNSKTVDGVIDAIDLWLAILANKLTKGLRS